VGLVLEAGGIRAVDVDGSGLGSHQAYWFAWSQLHPGTVLRPGEPGFPGSVFPAQTHRTLALRVSRFSERLAARDAAAGVGVLHHPDAVPDLPPGIERVLQDAVSQ
jgi:hypothetical protein